MGAIDLSFLTSWYDAKAGITPGATGASGAVTDASVALTLLGGSAPTGSTDTGSGAPTAPTNPTPPWLTASVSAAALAGPNASLSPQTLALVQSALNGGQLIDPSATKLDVNGGNASATENYRNLFALFQGLTALQGLAQQASSAAGGFQVSQLQQAFKNGMQQVQSFLAGQPFQGFAVDQSNSVTTDVTTTTTPTETDTYTTQPIFSGAVNSEIPAFQGDVQFDMNVTKFSGSQDTVHFDLSEMGSTPRTMSNVVNYLNGKLQDAGLGTRFASVFTPGAPQTVQVGGKSVTLQDSPDQYSLKVVGSSAETLSFSAAAVDPAVYIGQSSGITTGAAPDAVRQLVKFDASAAPADDAATNGQAFKQTLSANVGAVQATASAPDGSVYVLANVAGPVGGQPINGAQDVALIKYDSAGNVVYTRNLGAPTSASGLGLAVSADGSQVAITGSTTDNLNPTASTATTGSQSAAVGAAKPPQGFVTVFNSLGEEQWTQQIAAVGGNGLGVAPSSVAFGPNDMVYVAGQVDGSLPGATKSANTNGFIQAFHAVSTPLKDGTGASEWVVAPTYASEFATGGSNRATGIAVSGSSVYVAGVEGGDAVVRQFDQSGTGSTSLSATAVRDLGSLQGGSVAGVAVNADGSIVVAGSTHNAALDAGTVTEPFAGGENGFIASLSPGLQASASDRLTYLGSATDQNITGLTTSEGLVYVTGQIATTPLSGSGETAANNAYAAAVDPATGQASWSQVYGGQEREAAPTSIAVSQSGASVLDQLGLPNGAMNYAVSSQLVANSALRPGDKFFVRSQGGVAQAVTIAADDTYKTLAQKIQKASNYSLTATVLPGTGGTTLSLKAAYADQGVQLLAGPPGSDALGALGLKEDLITANAGQLTLAADSNTGSALPASNSLKNGYALNLPSNLDLSSAAGIKSAITALAAAAATVKSVYADMITPPSSPATSNSGTVPQYLTDQIANYQAALERLTGSSG